MDNALMLDEDGLEEMRRLSDGDQIQPAAPVRPDWSIGLASDVIESARQAAGRIRARHRGMVEGILDTGQDLLAMKSKLGHGKFGAWVEASFGWSVRTAENYMRVADEFGDNRELVTQLPPTTLAGEAPHQIDRAKDISMSVFVNGIRFRRHGGSRERRARGGERSQHRQQRSSGSHCVSAGRLVIRVASRCRDAA